MLTLKKQFKLLGSNGKFYLSDTPGTFGGHRVGKLYGRLDCRSALQAIARGGYVKHRVFFADEATAIEAGCTWFGRKLKLKNSLKSCSHQAI